MVVIFSSGRIEGLEGTYAAPSMASNADIAKASVVYTDNKRIIAMAKTMGIQVRDFPKHPPTGKVETIVPLPVADEPFVTPIDVLEPLEPLNMVKPEDNMTINASSSIEEDIIGGMSTKDLKTKYGVTGGEIGKIRRSLKAK